MRGIGLWLGVVSFLSFSSFLSQNGYAQTLLQRWDEEKKGSVTEDVQIPQDRHVLFISGIMNNLAKLISAYYKSNIEAVHELGLQATSYGPSSRKSIPTNAEIVYQRIIETYERHHDPVVVIGHSKGGAETLYTILEHPNLIVDGIVDRVVLIQPAIGGSPLATLEHGCSTFWMFCFYEPNFDTLVPAVIKADFDHAFSDYEKFLHERWPSDHDIDWIQKQKENISNKIFYVRSEATPDELSTGVKIVLGALHSELSYESTSDGFHPTWDKPTLYSGRNDGLVPIESQWDQRIGVDLGILESDHLGLTVDTVSKTSREDRIAFTRALFKTIYTAPEPVSTSKR